MIRQFNERLNSSTQMESRYEIFKPYRNEITGIIVDIVNQKSAKTLLVMAAGNLADVDYLYIVSHTVLEKIILTDIDEAGLERGYIYQHLEGTPCKYKAVNYLGDESEGLTQTFISAMCNSTLDPIALVDEYRTNICGSVSTVVSEKYDLVVVLPIYTQMIFLQLNEALKACEKWQECREYFFESMIYIIDAFNQKAIKHVNEKGSVLVLSDIMEVPSQLIPLTPLQEEVSLQSTLLETGNSLEKDKMLEAYIKREIDTYEKTYGIGLGSFGLMNLGEYGKIKDTYYFLWKFDDKRTFMVKGFWLYALNNPIPHDDSPRK